MTSTLEQAPLVLLHSQDNRIAMAASVLPTTRGHSSKHNQSEAKSPVQHKKTSFKTGSKDQQRHYANNIHDWAIMHYEITQMRACVLCPSRASTLTGTANCREPTRTTQLARSEAPSDCVNSTHGKRSDPPKKHKFSKKLRHDCKNWIS